MNEFRSDVPYIRTDPLLWAVFFLKSRVPPIYVAIKLFSLYFPPHKVRQGFYSIVCVLGAL